MKLNLMGNVNVDPLEPVLRDALDGRGLDCEVRVSPYNSYAVEILDHDSPYHRFSPDVSVLLLEGNELLQDVLDHILKSPTTEKLDVVRKRAGEIIDILVAAKKAHEKGLMMVSTIKLNPQSTLCGLEGNSPYSIRRIEQEFNEVLMQRSNELGFVVVGLDGLIEQVGYSNWFDERLWYIGRIPYSNLALHKLADMLLSYITALKAGPRKCLVLDLDNTLWGGIIGEAGLSGIQLGEDGIARAYRDFQKAIRQLTAKGIILAVASKNDTAAAQEAIEKHPYMVLRKEDFSAMKINWRDKAANIKEISAELNIGLDSFVFLDDSSFERELVRSQLPEVETPDLPDDPVQFPGFLRDLEWKYFNKVSLTDEDKTRTDIYRAQAAREQFRKQVVTVDDFYEGLDMRLRVWKNEESHIPRMVQLMERTNQFNLTARKYSLPEVEGFVVSDDVDVFTGELLDRFGSNGISVMMIVKNEQTRSLIDVFLMSCRIIGRRVEGAFWWYVAGSLRKRGISQIEARYLPTKRNNLVQDLYAKLDFSLVQDRDGETCWKYDTSERLPPKSRWIEIIEE